MREIERGQLGWETTGNKNVGHGQQPEENEAVGLPHACYGQATLRWILVFGFWQYGSPVRAGPLRHDARIGRLGTFAILSGAALVHNRLSLSSLPPMRECGLHWS